MSRLLPLSRDGILVAAALLAPMALSVTCATTAGASSPTVTISPVGPYHDGEEVTVSVSANSVFTSQTKVNILECADPGGTTAGLPSSDKSCDGQTLQNGTLYVGDNGSVSESGYVLYSLPSVSFDEPPSSEPKCDGSNQCALFVGVSQNDFGQAHMFSAGFTIDPAPTSSTFTAPTNVGSTATSNPASGVSGLSSSVVPPPVNPGASAAVNFGGATTDPAAIPGTLAFTGDPSALPWVLVAGAVLVMVGTVMRRRLAIHRLVGGDR